MSEVLESQYSLDEAEKINPNYSEKDGCLVIDEQEPQNISCQEAESDGVSSVSSEPAEVGKKDLMKKNNIFDDESDSLQFSPEGKTNEVDEEQKLDDTCKEGTASQCNMDPAKDEDIFTNEVAPKTSIQEICSESQRIARKSAISLPYHKPKQRSLLEFLNRKRASTAEGKPSTKDLPNILKLIEDRSQEAESFYGGNDSDQSSICETSAASSASTVELPHTTLSKQRTEQNVELKLDGNSPERQEATIESHQLRRHSLGSALCLSKILQKPRLGGQPGEILDLDGGSAEVQSKNRTGVAGFVELALQQIALSSKRVSTSREKRDSIADTATDTNRDAELTNKGSNEEMPLYPLQRNKLKEALQNSISEKRAAARMRKQQDSKIDNEQEEEEEVEEEEEELELDELSDSDDDSSFIGRKKSKKRKKRIDFEVDDDEDTASSDEKEAPSSSKVSPEIPESQEDENRSIEAATPDLNPSPCETKDGKLFSTQSQQDGSFNELLALCSGTFPATGKPAVEDDEPEEDENENVEATPGDVSEHLPTKEAKLRLSDDENSHPDHSSAKSKRKKLLPLLLSDDEDEANNDEDLQSIKSDDESEAEVKAPTDFFEKEAELSGSELGSDDEREDEEDEWEMEEGDKEDIDEDEVREQVERAHLKTMLDEDQREVRLFQELFLEDGDLHAEGGGRKKQFKWNASEGFEREPSQDENNPEEPDACDGPDEAAWRKAKNEREKWLQEKGMSVVMDDVKFKTKTVKIVKTKVAAKSGARDNNPDTNPLLSSPTKNDVMLKVRRGSFLRRGEKELTDIASLAKVLQPVQAPTASSNFVFASVTPKRAATEKRKVKTEETGVEVSPRAPPSKKSKIKGASKSVFSFLES